VKMLCYCRNLLLRTSPQIKDQLNFGGVNMFKSGFLLETDHHLQTAMFNKLFVIVWQDDEIIH
jgi:hypothetical protein